jgi:hypothetical protein
VAYGFDRNAGDFNTEAVAAPAVGSKIAAPAAMAAVLAAVLEEEDKELATQEADLRAQTIFLR